jgi:hypothetical protein
MANSAETALTRRLSELDERVTALEQALAGNRPADGCRFCGERAVRLQSSQATSDERLVQEQWHCSACDNVDVSLVRPR